MTAKQDRARGWTAGAVLGTLLLSVPAQAHQSTSLGGGFVAGVLHPLLGPDHLLAMVAVGLWGTILGRPLIALLPVIFPSVMAGGAVLAILGVRGVPVEVGIALSALLLGLAIAGKIRAPVWLACALVAAFAVCHGFAHGSEIPSLANPVAYCAGFVLATGSLHLLGIGLGVLAKWPRGMTLIRVLGLAIAVSGGGFLYGALT